MVISSKPAERIALTSLSFSIVFFGVAFFVGRWSGFYAISSVGWLILSAGLIWFVLVIQFHQRSLAEREKLDMSQLSGDAKSGTIFQATGGRAELFAVAQGRLKLLEKWFLPFFSAAIGIFQIAIGLYLLKAYSGEPEVTPKQPLVCAFCMIAVEGWVTRRGLRWRRLLKRLSSKNAQ